MMGNYPKKGQIVYCHDCDEPLFELKKDIEMGDEKLGPNTLEPIGQMKSRVKLNSSVQCWKCDSYVDTENMIIR